MADVAVLAGVGPGFCESFARELAENGRAVGLFARSDSYLEDLESTLLAEGLDVIAVPTDVTDPAAVAEGFAAVRDRFGTIDVLAHSASTTTGGTDDPIDADRFEHMWRLYAYGGLLCFREALPDLRQTGGTVLFFGASPTAGDIAFKSGKDATRGLARGLASEFASDGIHVAHVIIDGGLLNPDVYDGQETVDEDAFIDIDAAARTCHHLVDQPAQANTFELDLHAGNRPAPL